jgi:diguanylate cyclase (GGDEF)-like protein
LLKPPKSTATSRILSRLANAAVDLPRARSWIVTVLTLVAMLVLETMLDVRATLIMGFAIAATVAAWCLGERAGFLIAALSTLGDGAIRHARTLAFAHGPTLATTEVWNAVTRFGTLALVVVLVTGMRTAFALERWRAAVDSLTGVLNYGAFEREAAGVMGAARAAHQTVVLAVMDLDGFKQVNDRHGHSAGDRVLKDFATTAVGVIRNEDLFARIGGDEFVALLVVRSVQEGENVAMMVHERLSRILAAAGLGVSCSMGALIMVGDEIVPGDGHIELADKLMYEVKRAGKNALRIGRPRPIATALRAAYAVPEKGYEFDDLLAALRR